MIRMHVQILQIQRKFTSMVAVKNNVTQVARPMKTKMESWMPTTSDNKRQSENPSIPTVAVIANLIPMMMVYPMLTTSAHSSTTPSIRILMQYQMDAMTSSIETMMVFRIPMISATTLMMQSMLTLMGFQMVAMT